MSIEKALMEKLFEGIDISKYQADIDKAVAAYFKSESFKVDFEDAMSQEGIAYDLVSILKPKINAVITKNLKVTIGAK